MTKSKNKNYCTKCRERHIPPTGSKCKKTMTLHSENELSPVPSTSKSVSAVSPKKNNKKVRHRSHDKGKTVTSCSDSKSDKKRKKKTANQQNCSESSSDDFYHHTSGSQQDTSASEEEDTVQPDVQQLILQQLQRVNKRLDAVESQVAGTSTQDKDKTRKKLSRTFSKRKHKHYKSELQCTDSSSDEDMLPSLGELRSSHRVQKQVDMRLAALEKNARKTGNDSTEKNKSLRGGLEVIVRKKVAWPHESILGGPSRQRDSPEIL